jgi:lysophospholipase L1-like esterase
VKRNYFRSKIALPLTAGLIISSGFFYSIKAQQNSPTDTLKYKNNPSYDLQMGMFDLYKTKQADIVMLGNSLTAGTNWAELLGRQNVVSRAIPGDILQGFASRIGQVTKLKPKIVFVMGGLNDIYSWIPVEEAYKNYLRVIETLRAKGITVVIQLTTYVAQDYAKQWGGTPQVNLGRNREIDKLNKLLSDYGRKNNIELINLLPSIATKDGYLKPELSWDGVHFKSEAYRIWAREVERVLRKYNM